MMTLRAFGPSTGALLAASAACLMASAAGAQDRRAPGQETGASTGVEDVFVTAERRNTRLLRTPGSITPVAAEELRERHIEGLNDLSVSAPGLSSTGGAPQSSLFIRGIGTSDPGSPPAVGIYIDDIYNPRAFGNNLFDLPDVAALRCCGDRKAPCMVRTRQAGPSRSRRWRPVIRSRAAPSSRLGTTRR